MASGYSSWEGLCFWDLVVVVSVGFREQSGNFLRFGVSFNSSCLGLMEGF